MNRDLPSISDIKQSIFHFLDFELRRVVLSILPEKEKGLLPLGFSETNNIKIFEEYFFVIEKFLDTHIVPQKYNICYSSKVKKYLLENDDVDTKLKKKLQYFQNGFKRNDKSFNFLPKSAYTYYTDETKSKNHRKYINDFLFNSFGIRHFHLVDNNDNDLIYYVLIKNNIYLINIGNHDSIYEEETPKILIEEYPDLLEQLKISKLSSDIDPGSPCWGRELECCWKHGISVIPLINGNLYTATFMSLDGMERRYFDILTNILYQLNNQLNEIMTLLENKHYNIFLKKAKSKMSLKSGGIYIADRNSSFEYCIELPYFTKLQLVDMIIIPSTSKESLNG